MWILNSKKVKIKYKTKLMLAYLLAIAIPLAIGLTYIYNNLIANANKTLNNTLLLQLEEKENIILDQVNNANNSAYILSTQKNIVEFFTPSFYETKEIIHTMNNDITPTLAWFEDIETSIDEFYFLTENRSIPESEFLVQAYPYLDKDWYKNYNKNREESDNFYGIHKNRNYKFTDQNSDLLYSWIYPVLLPSTSAKTILQISISAKNLLPVPKSSKEIFLLYSDDNIIKTSTSSFIDNWASKENIEKIIYNIESIGGKIEINSSTYSVSNIFIEEIDAYLVSLVLYEEISPPLDVAKSTFITITILIVTIVIVASYIISTLLVKRIYTIIDTVKEIQKGCYTKKIPITSTDEVGELSEEINIMAQKIDTLINTVFEAEKLEKQSELAALQSQINPHFLFNTLETIKMSAEIKEYEKTILGLSSLGGLMRYTLFFSGAPVLLNLELKHLINYLNIQQMLLDNRLVFKILIPQDVQDSVTILPLTIQPVVENSIKHGFKNPFGILEITIYYEQLDSGINLCIKDNGVGISEDEFRELTEMLNNKVQTQNSTTSSIGLWNINKRLFLSFGAESRLQMYSEKRGLLTKIYLPRRENDV
ncbi:MAG: sensor histidine kinase [Lachnospirales bacterium]